MKHPNASVLGMPLVTILLLFSTAARPESVAPTLPQYGADAHLGVVTCAGSTCHGATKPFQDTVIMQDEFVIWHRKDKHAKAYQVLLNDQSKRIARNLGLEAAHTAKICLDCHADPVPEELRGKRFQLSDGVGCESCHGGAKRYLGPHVSGENTRQDNINAGMYPTEQPEARAKLCLSCHLGTEDKFATHRIMGAGHPRISFELDTFTEIQPAHFRVDEDYKKRKMVWSGVQIWAIGQMLAVDQFLSLLASSKFQNPGPWPELAFFDCHACHHSMSERRWRPRDETIALGPGVIRFNDANLLIFNQIVNRLAPELGTTFKQAIVDLHKASMQNKASVQAAISRLRKMTDSIRGRLMQHQFSASDMKSILRAIVVRGASGEFSDYATAEQATMAIASIRNTLERTGSLAPGEKTKLTTTTDEIYKVLEDPDKYKPEQFETTLQSLAGTLSGS